MTTDLTQNNVHRQICCCCRIDNSKSSLFYKRKLCSEARICYRCLDCATQPSGGDGKWQMANRKSLHDLAAGCTGFGRVVQRVAGLEIFQEIEPVIACLLCRLPGCSLMLR